MFGRDEEAQSVDQVDCGSGVNADLEVDLEEIYYKLFMPEN